jgi:hypothetical protein
MKMNNVRRILELGAGFGRDTTLFASNGIEVEAVDYSNVALHILDRITKEKRLPITPRIFNVRRALPFQIAILILCIHTGFLTCAFHSTSFYFQK